MNEIKLLELRLFQRSAILYMQAVAEEIKGKQLGEITIRHLNLVDKDYEYQKIVEEMQEQQKEYDKQVEIRKQALGLKDLNND